MKKTASVFILASILLLSGCTKSGLVPTNLNSDDTLIEEEISFSDDSLKDLMEFPDIGKYKVSQPSTTLNIDEELKKRKENFVITTSGETVLENDVVNITFIKVTEKDSSDQSEWNFDYDKGYDFDLSEENLKDFKDKLINENAEVGSTKTISDCKWIEGKTVNLELYINYVTRSVDNSVLDELVPSKGDNEQKQSYEEWLKSALSQADYVNLIWEKVLNDCEFKESSEIFVEYVNKKYDEALEYYTYYGSNFSAEEEAALKESIKKQCKKILIAKAYYEEKRLNYNDNYDNIVSYYGYTKEAFELKYSKEVREDTLIIDAVGIYFLEQIDN